MNTLTSILVDALAYGMVLFIISIGLSIMLGLARVVNLAHGGFAMIGGVLASFAVRTAGLPYGVAVVAAILGVVLLTWPLERLLYHRIYTLPPLPQVLTTIGITFCIIGLTNFAFGPTVKSIPLPPLLSGPVDIGFRTLPAHRIFVIACGTAVAIGLWYLIERTEFGIRLRAAVDNRAIASALGIRTNRLYAIAFSLSAALAALGGIVGAELMPIEPFYALRYMAVFLVVVSVGGAGSIAGSVAASLLLALADTTAKYLVPDYGEFIFYLTVIGIVSLFPNGLLGRPQ
ncbi:branched-chain amino acid ABC transporter permease [Bradyrhizobium sp. AUGA SZCCT0182]|uniref:branched-chain amino acid ABC transporter permease n=1 Tax=Bradyrhizobium sp. AUGA SZCCT0182 TaxID=2807667 RepID=UPI001BAC84B0|nr:branched-chain amino acid ABC transporter permease [Bradyrhizobium sp. AUGA SZCCT0182]MBR1235882.1 branched-chain amino acid ABC transporter permease [Bradyrhizobium sp. AUGA SZCCT0182]